MWQTLGWAYRKRCNKTAVIAICAARTAKNVCFVELVVEYPDPELCTYKEYKGRPYYSIKYLENGEIHIGYGTYNPKVLSQYLKEYFISSAQPDRKKGKWIIRNVEDWMGRPTGKHFCKCDQCGEEEILSFRRRPFDFCPNCGADMKGE